MTARPVHMKWPRTPPMQTPETSLIPDEINLWHQQGKVLRGEKHLPAITIVANWDLSPHSARKVIMKVFVNNLNIFRHFLPNHDFSLICTCRAFLGGFVSVFVSFLSHSSILSSSQGFMFFISSSLAPSSSSWGLEDRLGEDPCLRWRQDLSWSSLFAIWFIPHFLLSLTLSHSLSLSLTLSLLLLPFSDYL